MENLISWFEIHATDFSRKVTFYKSILGLNIRETEIFYTKMQFFSADAKNVLNKVEK